MAGRRLDCLKMVSEINRLEDSFAVSELASDPSRRLGHVYGMSFRSVYVTLHYRCLSSMHTRRHIYFSISCEATAIATFMNSLHRI